MSTAKPLPPINVCTFCDCDTAWAVGTEAPYARAALVRCFNAKCGATGPTRSTKRGAINAWNRGTKA